MFIVYSGDGGVIVIIPEKENETVNEWFTKGGRNLSEYDREEFADEAISFGAVIKRW